MNHYGCVSWIGPSYTVEPPNNGQVGALILVRYSEVSFIGGSKIEVLICRAIFLLPLSFHVHL